jgi:hypothetical protein
MLLHILYKIMDKYLTLMLKHALHKIVRLDYMAFIQGSYILDNVIVVCEGMEWALGP